MSKQPSRTEKQESLKNVITRLHRGESVEQVKAEFHRLIKNISPEEISTMEQALLNEGFPAEEIQRLCEVHVAVFEKSLAGQKKASGLPGHPIHTFVMENRELTQRIKGLKKLLKKIKKQKDNTPLLERIKHEFEELGQVELHYRRKENQLFPYLEQKGFTGPSKVMWGKHNEIREKLKACAKDLEHESPARLAGVFGSLFSQMQRMIFMEEKILFPTSLKKLDEREWAQIRKGEPEIGYAWIKPGNVWDADIILQKNMDRTLAHKTERITEEIPGIPLDVGLLNREQINLMLKALPFDITYVDEHDKVRYYSGSEERIFPRSPAVIGRDVQNCHPQKSVETVNRILQDFREKKQKAAEFWIDMHGRKVHIRYFPVYNESGEYRGVIEVTQDITAIQKLDGERRLLDWRR
jgi:PAS domain S-box-containing protein